MRLTSRPGWAGTLTVLAAALAISACGGDPEVAATGPYTADVRSAQKQATSDLERDVLADGVIARSEYEAAVQAYVACARGRGMDAAAELNSGGIYTFSATGFSDEIDRACMIGTRELIEPLYVGIQQNPLKQDANELLAACFIRQGLVPTGYTGEQWRADLRANILPFDGEDPGYSSCMENPSAP